MTQLYFNFMTASDIATDRGLENLRKHKEELMEAFRTNSLYEWCAAQVTATHEVKRAARGLGLQPGGW